MSGKAYLVGAGPGSPDLLTLRGAQLLRQADAVVHDRLVEPAMLQMARAGARLIDVGKGPGHHPYAQGAINRLLISLVQAGQQVVRLKGGDPFVFGRGQEERDALRAAGCPVEVVPGVSAVTGVPTAAGVPLTHRDLASDFAVITGRFAQGKSPARTNWDALARMDTLVVLMGLGAVQEIQAGLLQAGKSPATPAMIIYQGTWAQQQVRKTDLAHLAATVQADPRSSPALIVLGDVVELGSGSGASAGEEPRAVSTPSADRDAKRQGAGHDLYPLTLTRLRDRKVLVLGGGPVGERKCRRLLAAGASVTVCSPTLTVALRNLAERGEITWHARQYQARDLKGTTLAFAATNDPPTNERIARDAASRGILCNVATDAQGGDFRVPALTILEDCLVAVTSFAGNPRTAQRIRDRIGDECPD